eukprot:1774888-Pyramimonas_sp.AAC.1
MRLCSAAVPPAFWVRPELSHRQSPLSGCAAVLGYRKSIHRRRGHAAPGTSLLEQGGRAR